MLCTYRSKSYSPTDCASAHPLRFFSRPGWSSKPDRPCVKCVESWLLFYHWSAYQFVNFWKFVVGWWWCNRGHWPRFSKECLICLKVLHVLRHGAIPVWNTTVISLIQDGNWKSSFGKCQTWLSLHCICLSVCRHASSVYWVREGLESLWITRPRLA